MVDLFSKCLPVILKHEGGYVNNPNDPGGETKYGISKAAFPELDIKNLSLEEAAKIYRGKYWGPSCAETIKDPVLALLHFDTAVNMGVNAALHILQEHRTVDGYAIRRTGKYVSLCKNNPKLKAFLLGWVDRVINTIEEGRKL
jgi:lysozyme family protein